MSSDEARGIRVALLADRHLVGQAIAAALVPRGISPMMIAWPRRRDRIATIRSRVERSGVSVGLIFCDLATPDRLYDVEMLVSPRPVRWLVLTDSDPGPRWGCVLEAGGTAVMPTTSGVDTLVAAIRSVVAGGPAMPDDVRDRVLEEWRSVAPEQRELVARMEQLTPRETQVLSMLYDGTGVGRIATLSGTSVSTVRSQVKAIRLKLHAESQLAAVAMYRRALEIFPRHPR